MVDAPIVARQIGGKLFGRIQFTVEIEIVSRQRIVVTRINRWRTER